MEGQKYTMTCPPKYKKKQNTLQNDQFCTCRTNMHTLQTYNTKTSTQTYHSHLKQGKYFYECIHDQMGKIWIIS